MKTGDGLSCREVVELVTDYLEGRLPPLDRRRFEEHLRGCTDCTIYLDQIRKTLQLFGTLTEEAIAPDTKEELLTRFRTWTRR